MNTVYLYLLSPLHTGGTTQEGNLLGIARESHTNLPYIPSSTIRGKLRSSVANEELKFKLFGNELNGSNQLTQGSIWIGDGSLLWIPVPSLSHGVIWVTSPMLLQRWARFNNTSNPIPADGYHCNFKQSKSNIYLKDAMLKPEELQDWKDWKEFVPQSPVTSSIKQVMILPDRHCATIVQMSLWRQVKVKLDGTKTVDGGFRYEEAIPPDTLMYFPWGTTAQSKDESNQSQEFKKLLKDNEVLQIGGQESLGRGFVQQWLQEE